jgi:hypothetical protein
MQSGDTMHGNPPLPLSKQTGARLAIVTEKISGLPPRKMAALFLSKRYNR